MSEHAGYFLSVEGIGKVFATAAYTPAGAWSSYTVEESIDRIGNVSFGVDPIRRKADVGTMQISLVDHHGTGDAAAGELTDLFATEKSQSTIYLGATITYGESMGGAGTVTAEAAIPASTAPCTFYIEGETFTCTGQAGAVFTGVTRAAFGSHQARHSGTTTSDNYRPRIYLNPPSWADRICKLYRVINEDMSTATLMWVGPLMDVQTTGVNSWSLMVGSVFKFLDTEVFTGNQIPLERDWQNTAAVYEVDSQYDRAFAFMRPVFSSTTDVIEESLAASSDGNAGGTTTPCTAVSSDPDDYYGTEYAIEWKTGDNAGEVAIIVDWTESTNTFTHAAMPNQVSSGDTFRLLKFNHWPPTNRYGGFFAVIGSSVVAVMCVAEPTDWSTYLGGDLETTGRDATLRGAWIIKPFLQGLWGGADGYSAPGELVKEVVGNWRQYPLTSYASYEDIFNWIRERAHPLASAFFGLNRRSPIAWFAEVWCSSGTGSNYSGSGTNFDVLARNHGASIPQDLIDLDTFEDLAGQMTTYPLAYVGPKKLKDILFDDICVPLSLYPSINSSGQLTLKRVERYDQNATPAQAITEADILETPTVEIDHLSIQGSVIAETEYSPISGEFGLALEFAEPNVRRLRTNSRPEKIEIHKWINRLGDTAGDTAFQATLSDALHRMLQRGAFPRVNVNVVVPFDDDSGTAVGRDLRPGDKVRLTLDQVVPLPTGTRTLGTEWFEVTDVELDFMQSRASLTLYWLGFYSGTYGRYSWTGIVSGWDAGTDTVTVTNELSQSGEDVTEYVQVGDKLRIHYCAASRKGGATYDTSEELTVDSRTATTITFTAAPANALVAETGAGNNDGDVITFCNYGNATDTQKELSFLADEGNSDIPGDEEVDGNDPYVWV